MKPRWPRFSLRTLIIAVLGIALCWTLTATWGVNTVFDFYSKTLDIEAIERNGNKMRVFRPRPGEDVTPDRTWTIRATAIAPFLIRLSGRRDDETTDEAVTHFWFFGYHSRLGPVERGPKK